MEDFMLLLVIIYAIVITLGVVLQKYFKLPWMFTIIITGLIFTTLHLFEFVKTDPAFNSFSKIGQYCLLFTIGLSIDLSEFKKLAKQIFLGNFITCFSEGFGLSLLFYFLIPEQFNNSFLICLLCGIGFSTIGEVILIAILTELKIEKTRFGQLTIGMGVADDFIEITVLTLVSTLPFFYNIEGEGDTVLILSQWIKLIISIGIVILLTLVSHKIGKHTKNIFMKIGKDYPFVNGFVYLIVFLGMILISGVFIEDVQVIGAIFAGLICQYIFPEKIAEKLEGNFRFLMMFIGPFFFFLVGYKISLDAIIANIVLLVLIIGVSIIFRVGSTMIVFRKEFTKPSYSMVFGFGLCTKFSTSIVILSLLLEYSYITPMIYSVIMTAFLVEKVITVFVYSISIGKIAKEAEKTGNVCNIDSCFRTEKKDLKNI